MVIHECWIFDIITDYIVKDEQGCIDSPEHLKTMTSFITMWWRPSFAPWFECGRQYLRYLSFNHSLCSSKPAQISQTLGKIEDVPARRSTSLLGRTWAHQKKNGLFSPGLAACIPLVGITGNSAKFHGWQTTFSGDGEDRAKFPPTTKVMKWRTERLRFGRGSSLHSCSLHCAPHWFAMNGP